MCECARPSCIKIGNSKCSTCLREAYCSGDCQKSDWKAHKLMCKTSKKLSNQLLPYREVVQVSHEIVTVPKNANDTRVLSHVLSYAEFQFGDRVVGKSYRERRNGE